MKEVDSPKQISFAPVMEGVGNGVTVIAMLEELVQPSELVAITEYVSLELGFTFIELVVSVVFHK
jgi:hypothetical protein